MEELVELIKNNKVALVTDAGTPGISDPGGLLIKALKQEYTRPQHLVASDGGQENIKIQGKKNKGGEDLEIVPIPGASAAVTALSVSGFPTDEFLFKGFIPHKKGRQTFLKEVLAEKRTVVFYESCHRIIKCLEEMKTLSENGTTKELMVGRELTKKFESIYRGNIQDVLEKVKADPLKGEYVIVVSPVVR